MPNKFDYFYREHPEVRKELTKLGITITEVGTGDDVWPGLTLPSGHVMAFAQDDEGNGPGAIHIFRPDETDKA